MKTKLLIIFITLFHFLMSNYAAADSKNCFGDANQLKEQFYKHINGAFNFKEAQKLIKSKEVCISNDYETSLLLDLNAEIPRYAFIKTHDIDFATAAEKGYLNALNYKSKHNEVIYFHLGMLYREMNELQKAIEYTNTGLNLNPPPNDPLPLLKLALLLSVDVSNWSDAKSLVDILFNREKSFYFELPILDATVKTLCHYKRKNIAEKFIANVENHRPNLNSQLNIKLDEIKKYSTTCENG